MNLDEIMVRFRIRANLSDDGTSRPSLLLETIVLDEGTWEAVSVPKKKALSGATSAAVLLWKGDVEWCFPAPESKLLGLLAESCSHLRQSLSRVLAPLPTKEYTKIFQ